MVILAELEGSKEERDIENLEISMGSGTLRVSCQFKACGFHGRRLCDAVYMSSSLFVCRSPFFSIYTYSASLSI